MESKRFHWGIFYWGSSGFNTKAVLIARWVRKKWEHKKWKGPVKNRYKLLFLIINKNANR